MPLTVESLEFLNDNFMYNSKDWYDSHKAEYKSFVVEPMTEIFNAMLPAMLSIDGDIISDPKKCISRLRRDTRFVKDKTIIYRDHIWFCFMRDKKLYNGLPSFYFQVSPNSFEYGCGYYHADTASMQSMRKAILNNNKYFITASKAYQNQNVFEFVGDKFKRDKWPNETPEKKEWLMRKNLCFTHRSTNSKLLFSNELPDKLSSDFKLLAPIYEFMMYAENQKSSD